MELRLYKTLWGHSGSFSRACDDATSAGFDGIEGPAPLASAAQQEWRNTLAARALDYIGEITTAGSYVPDRRTSLDDHLESLAQKLEASATVGATRVTCLGGCDAWPEDLSRQFYHRAMQMAADCGLSISFETHRGRPLFNPWVTDRLCAALPDMRLTADFSHWCVVSESLLEDQSELMDRLLPRVDHIHARVGYDQGPQVSNPAAAHYRKALDAHQAWWTAIWRLRSVAGESLVTMTPEFGPDGYQALESETGQPIGELWAMNCWMAELQRQRFGSFLSDRQVLAQHRSS